MEKHFEIDVLESIGFSIVTVCDFQEGVTEDILQDKEHRRQQRMYVSAQN